MARTAAGNSGLMYAKRIQILCIARNDLPQSTKTALYLSFSPVND